MPLTLCVRLFIIVLLLCPVPFNVRPVLGLMLFPLNDISKAENDLIIMHGFLFCNLNCYLLQFCLTFLSEIFLIM